MSLCQPRRWRAAGSIGQALDVGPPCLRRRHFLEDGELLILATNHRPKSALADYRLRWGIETLFAALKTRGFNLESTHFCHPERLSKLIALLALAFCWAMLTGLWQHQQHPIPVKAHGRRAKASRNGGYISAFWY